ncbi:hypothetical protein ACFIOY_19595 [Bradyrhizobium sp. TZ2]
MAIILGIHLESLFRSAYAAQSGFLRSLSSHGLFLDPIEHHNPACDSPYTAPLPEAITVPARDQELVDEKNFSILTTEPSKHFSA